MIPRPFFPFFTNSCGRLMHIVSKYVGCATWLACCDLNPDKWERNRPYQFLVDI